MHDKSKKEHTLFLSYSHDSEDFKLQIRKMADDLIGMGIRVNCDCYEEDMPYGAQMTDMMHLINVHDKVLLVLSPQYKIKADEGIGGVGYEGMLITDEIYRSVKTSKFIPVILDEGNFDLSDFFPIFLSRTRKAILKKNFHSYADFIREIAGAVAGLPKKPKPLLGSTSWMQEGGEETHVETQSLALNELVNVNASQQLFNNALYFAKKGMTLEFRKLSDLVLELSIKNILILREECEAINIPSDKAELHSLMDKFIDAIRPVFLICFAGYLSGNSDFNRQEGIMFDLLSIDKWNNRAGRTTNIMQSVPSFLVYAYHHLYGALHIKNSKPDAILKILNFKLPANNSRINYELLYKMKSVTGWIDSLGRDCFDSFKYLLNAYERWDWLKIIFNSSEKYKTDLTTYQAVIHLLNYFSYIKIGGDDEFPFDIPPSFVVATEYKSTAERWIIKNSDYFKSYLKDNGIDLSRVIAGWKKWSSTSCGFRLINFHYTYFPDNLVENILM